MLPFSLLGELIFLLLQVNTINLTSWDTTEGENDQCQCQPHKIVLQKITSTILFLPFSMAHGGEGAPQMGTWHLWGENLNTAKSAWHPPREPREHPLWEAAVYLRAPLSSISQENGSKKKLYSPWLHEKISALLLEEMLRRKSYNEPTRETKSIVN